VSTTAILAVIFALFIIVKISIVFIYPHGWFKFADALLRNTILMTVVYLVLAAIVGYYILRSFSIVQVAAVMLFTSLLIGLALIPFSETMLSIREGLLGSRLDILRKTWLTLLIWIAIAVWTLYEVFTKKVYTLNYLP
jgi:hypothetical protein